MARLRERSLGLDTPPVHDQHNAHTSNPHKNGSTLLSYYPSHLLAFTFRLKWRRPSLHTRTDSARKFPGQERETEWAISPGDSVQFQTGVTPCIEQ